MIKLLRVDHRLLHGQVAFSWTSFLNADSILIANDSLPKDEIKKTTMRLAKPHGIKLVMKSLEDSVKAINSGITDKYDLFIVVESIEDAAYLVNHCPSITEVNLGGVKKADDSRRISNAIYITKEEENILKNLVNNNIDVEIRQVPSDSKINVKKVLK